MNRFQDKLIDIGNKLGAQPHLQSISRGLMTLMPLTIFGSIFQLISALPDIFPFIPAYSDSVSAAILFPYNMAFGVIGVLSAVTIAYYHAQHYSLNNIQAAVLSLITFVVVAAPIDSDASTMNSSFLGSQGIFMGIIVGLVSVEIMRLIDKSPLKFKFPDSIPPFVASSFNAIIPMVIVVTLFYALSLICQAAAGCLLPELIMTVLAPALTASESLWFCMLVAFLIALLQVLGVHGFNVLSGIFLPLMITNTMTNAEAFGAGEVATKVFTLPMFQMSGVFVWIIPALMLRCKSERAKTMGKISIVPAIFNIAEPIQYGAPIVLNPLLAVPWILMFTINMAIVWCAMTFGFMAKAVVMASSNIPIPVFWYLCTLDWKSIIVFIVMLVIDYFLWKPFIVAWDNQCLKEEQEKVSE